MKHPGGCHCGNIAIEFESAVDPAEIEVRACQCAFCRKHASRAVADPAGRVAIRVADAGELQRYAFGLRTAAYLVCRRCGVYVAAVAEGEGELRAIAIVNALDDHRRFTRPSVPVDYDAEDRGARVARRRARWTPATLTIVGQESSRTG
jgi:hypothetical protein